MAKVLVSENYLADIADAIREKKESEDTYNPSEMADAIESIQTGITPTGTKQVSIISNGTTIEDVANYASAEITVNVPSGSATLVTKSITENGTYSASSDNADGYSSVTVNVAASGDPKQYLHDAFNGTLTTYEDDTLTQIRIAIPSSITRFICHNVTTASNISLISGSNLTALAFPKMINWSVKSGFASATKLTAIDLAVAALNQLEFSGCTVLSTIILRHTTIVTLASTNTFNNTPFASGKAGGTIYIPKVLYDQLGTGTNDYKAATNWSTIDGYGTITWAQIEGSIYETQYADGETIPTT